jgi:hypothetical protein
MGLYFSNKLHVLKVVGNQKRGGSGSKLLIEYCFGPWRSMSVVRTGKKICETKFEFYWRIVSGQHSLLAEGDIGAPIFTSTNSSVRLAYFHTNRLLFGLYKHETEILRRKDEGNIKK